MTSSVFFGSAQARPCWPVLLPGGDSGRFSRGGRCEVLAPGVGEPGALRRCGFGSAPDAVSVVQGWAAVAEQLGGVDALAVFTGLVAV